MSLEKHLLERANQQCELCTATDRLTPYAIEYSPDTTANCAILLCGIAMTNSKVKSSWISITGVVSMAVCGHKHQQYK